MYFVIGVQCGPLTVAYSDTNNVTAEFEDTVQVTCIHGYQNSARGRSFTETCLENAAWSITDICQREL